MGGRVTINATLNGLPQGTITLGPITISPSSDNLVQQVNQVFPIGDLDIDVPNWAVGMLIQPDPTNTIGFLLSSTAEEGGGLNISAFAPTLISFPSPAPSFITFTVTNALMTTTTITFF